MALLTARSWLPLGALCVPFLLLVLLDGALGAEGPQSPAPAASCSTNYQFDQFVLAIQWPLSFCAAAKVENSCNLAIARKKRWLLHGLWPNRASRPKRNTNSNRARPDNIEFCCGPAYNASALSQEMQRELLDKWPTLHSNAKHHNFWKHEWQKHGTCSRQLAGLKTQQQYFETVLGLYNRFDLNRAQGLRSNETYPLEQLHRAIEPLVGGKRVRLECSLATRDKRQTAPDDRRGGGSQKKTSIFAEVHICLDKTLQPIDCARPDDQQCKKRVLFP